MVEAAATSGIKGLDGFTVGLADEEVEAATAEIEESGTTDAQGRISLQVPVSELAAARPTQARIVLRVGEPGGRAVERSVTLPVLPQGPVLGVRKNFGDDLAEGATATFDVVLASPDGTRLARAGVVWSLYKVERRYQWFNQEGRWGFEPVESTRRVADGTIDLAADAPARIAAAVNWGAYRLDVAAPGLGEGADKRLLHGRLVGRSDRRCPRSSRHGARQGKLSARRERSWRGFLLASRDRRRSPWSATRSTTSGSSTWRRTAPAYPSP